MRDDTARAYALTASPPERDPRTQHGDEGEQCDSRHGIAGEDPAGRSLAASATGSACRADPRAEASEGDDVGEPPAGRPREARTTRGAGRLLAWSTRVSCHSTSEPSVRCSGTPPIGSSRRSGRRARSQLKSRSETWRGSYLDEHERTLGWSVPAKSVGGAGGLPVAEGRGVVPA